MSLKCVKNYKNVDVVIPVYNKEATIEQCLMSVLNQSYQPTAVVIVFDGSTDRSHSIVSSFKKNHGHNLNLIILDQKNRGVAIARNFGFSKCDSEYVAFLDSDDFWDVDYLDRMLCSIKSFPGHAFYSCGHSVIREQGVSRFVLFKDADADVIEIFDYCQTAKSMPIVNSSKVIIDSRYFELSGKFPEGVALGEDHFLWVKLSQYNNLIYTQSSLVNINQFPDDSRSGRIYKSPYLIDYYSSRKKLVWPSLMSYMRKIYVIHIVGSLVSANRPEAIARIKSGRQLFPVLALVIRLVLILPHVFFRLLRNYRFAKAKR